MGNEKEFTKKNTFVCKPIENVEDVNKIEIDIDFEKEYEKMQIRYNKLLDKNKKLEKALINFALKVLEE